MTSSPWQRSVASRQLQVAGAILAVLLLAQPVAAQQKRVYLAPDDHTDYIWSATEAEYRQYFLDMLDYYLDQADATAGLPSVYQSRFNTDGSFWLWTYERNRTQAQFNRLMSRIADGHISSPLTPLVVTWGGVPAEAAIRAMLYPGRLERRFNVRFPLAQAMENQTMPYGLGSIWAGGGAKYVWHGVCGCATVIPELDNRDHEIYRWQNADGSSLLVKWFSLTSNQSIGGYAESRFPQAAVDYVTTNAGSNGFATRYPYSIIGVFGQGWDDRFTLNLNIQTTAQSATDATRQVIVSNEKDYFEDFEQNAGATLPNLAQSFGNEWDTGPASLAEVSARLKRATEKLRTAEALAILVARQNPGFLVGREGARDLAMIDLGLYFEHDFLPGGPGATAAERLAFQRRVADEVDAYVNSLHDDARAALAGLVQRSGTNPRFFAFNPLSWTRTDIADLPYAGELPVHVVDVSTGLEVPSQIVTLSGQAHVRIQAPGVPSVGYKVFEIQPGAGQAFPNPLAANAATGVVENDAYRLTLTGRGAITSFVDKTRGNREFVQAGGAFNDLGGSGGTVTLEGSVGPVSVTLVAQSTFAPARTTRLTLFRDSDRAEIRDEVTQNFSNSHGWSYTFNLTSPDVRHEEVGAILRARLTSAGGHYATRNARYDYLTLNHFADITGSGNLGVTLANADAYFMALGNSTITTLDTATPKLTLMLGGQLGGFGLPSQGGDSYFLQRFALRTHDAPNEAAAMRFALEHQNPFVVGAVTGGSAYPATSYSAVNISNPDVLLWALKPAEDGLASAGVVARVWNLSPASAAFTLDGAAGLFQGARRTTHIETPLADLPVGGPSFSDTLTGYQMRTYLLTPQPTPVELTAFHVE